MKLLNRLERKYGDLAIKGLIKYIIIANAVVFMLGLGPTRWILNYLYLSPTHVMQGQIWRLITFVFIPPATTPIFIFFVLYFYYMVGSGLESYWGSFKFNVYYLIGMISTIIASLIVGSGTGTYLNLSMFLAFAWIYPDFQLLIFFILPVKMKYLAMFNWAFIGYTVIFYPLPLKIVAIVSVLNFLIFFGQEIINKTKNKGEIYSNRRRFAANVPKKTHFHKCHTCGLTENDDPQMDFRYCSGCDEDLEYCMDHLKNHAHVVKSKVINIDRSRS